MPIIWDDEQGGTATLPTPSKKSGYIQWDDEPAPISDAPEVGRSDFGAEPPALDPTASGAGPAVDSQSTDDWYKEMYQREMGLQAENGADFRYDQSLEDEFGGPDNLAYRTGETVVQSGRGSIANMVGTTLVEGAKLFGADDFEAMAQEGREGVRSYIRRAADYQAAKDKESFRGASTLRQAGAAVGESLAASALGGLPALATYYAGGTAAEKLGDADAQGKTGFSKYGAAAAHSAIEAAFTVVGGKVLGAGTGLLAAGGKRAAKPFAETVAGRAAGYIAAKSRGKISKGLIGIGVSGGAEAIEEVSTELSHYLTEVGFGKKFDGEELYERLIAAGGTALLAGSGARGVSALVDATIDQRRRQKDLPATTAAVDAAEKFAETATPEQMADAARAANRKDFTKATGEQNTTQQHREVFTDEMKRMLDEAEKELEAEARPADPEPDSPLMPEDTQSDGVEPDPKTHEARLTQNPIESVPVGTLSIDPERFQFKGGVTEKGVVAGEQLEGDYNPLAGGVLLVWEDKSGKRFVVNGHHRFDLAKRKNVENVNAQIVREADGITVAKAKALGAELNILEGQGSVDDYTKFFRHTEINKEQAEKRGLLARTKGRTGFLVGRIASDETYAAYRNGKLSAEKAAIIAEEGEGDEGFQQLGIAKAKGLNPEELRATLKAFKLFPRSTGGGGQKDLFGGYDDSIIKEAEAIGKAAAEIVQGINERILSVRGAIKRPEIAKKMGLSGDLPSIEREAKRLAGLLDDWSRWSTDPGLVREARQRAGLPIEFAMPAPEPEPAPAPEPAAPEPELALPEPELVLPEPKPAPLSPHKQAIQDEINRLKDEAAGKVAPAASKPQTKEQAKRDRKKKPTREEKARRERVANQVLREYKQKDPTMRFVQPKSQLDKDAKELAEALGRTAYFIDSDSDTWRIWGSAIINEDVIFLHVGNANLWYTVGHELAHSTNFDEMFSSKADKKFLDDVFEDFIRDRGPLARANYEMRERDWPGTMHREAVAHLVGQFMQSRSFRAKLADANPSLAQRLREYILKFFENFTPKSQAYVDAIEHLRNEVKPGKEIPKPKKEGPLAPDAYGDNLQNRLRKEREARTGADWQKLRDAKRKEREAMQQEAVLGVENDDQITLDEIDDEAEPVEPFLQREPAILPKKEKFQSDPTKQPEMFDMGRDDLPGQGVMFDDPPPDDGRLPVDRPGGEAFGVPINLRVDLGSFGKAAVRGFKAVKQWIVDKFLTSGPIGPQKELLKLLNNKRLGTIAKHLKKLVHLQSDLDAAVWGQYGKTRTIPPDVRLKMSDALKGHRTDLPDDIVGAIVNMREQIDAITREFIRAGIGDQNLQLTFDENMGAYVTRTYAKHQRADWAEFAKRDPKLMAEARDALKVEFPQDSDEDIQWRINFLLDKDSLESKDMPERFLKDAKFQSILMKRQDLPEWLRDLYGENHDAWLNHSLTVTKMAQLLGDHEMMTELRRLGLEAGFFQEVDPKDLKSEPPAEGEPPLPEDMQGRLPIRDDNAPQRSPFTSDGGNVRGLPNPRETQKAFMYPPDNAEMPTPTGANKQGKLPPPGRNPDLYRMIDGRKYPQLAHLHGLYTDPATHKALVDMFSAKSMAGYMRYWMGASAFAKWNLTVGNAPRSVFRNFLGNIAFAASNGDLLNGDYRKAWKATAVSLLNMKNEEMRKYLVRLAELRVTEGDLSTSEVKRQMGDLADAGYDVPITGGTAGRTVARGIGFLNDFYQHADIWWKINGFESKKKYYKKLHPSKSETEIEEMAAADVRRAYTYYDEVPAGIQAINKLAPIGNFLNFQSEVIRTTKNAIETIRRERASDNPIEREMGNRRLVGLLGSMAALPLASFASQILFGVSGDDDEDTRLFQRPWTENSPYFYTSRIEDGKVGSFDLAFLDPRANWTSAIYAALRPGTAGERAARAIGEISEPLGPDILLSRVFAAGTGTTFDGRKIYTDSMSTGEKMRAAAAHVGGAIIPGTIQQLNRIKKANRGEIGPDGKPYSLKLELIALGGFRPAPVDVRQSFAFASNDNFNGIRGSEQDARYALQQNGTVSLSALERKVASAFGQRQQYVDTWHKQYKAAVRLGVPVGEVGMQVKSTAQSLKLIRQVIAGSAYPYQLTPASRKIIGSKPDGEKRLEIYDRLYAEAMAAAQPAESQ
jgi:hypothetical protein